VNKVRFSNLFSGATGQDSKRRKRRKKSCGMERKKNLSLSIDHMRVSVENPKVSTKVLLEQIEKLNKATECKVNIKKISYSKFKKF
jgi:hypothetical protein